MPELLEAVRAVQRRRVVQIVRDILQRRIEEQQTSPDARPKSHKDHGRHETFFIQKPEGIGELKAEALQELPQDPVVRREHPLPDERDRDRSADRGDIEDHAQHRRAAADIAQHSGDDQRDRRPQRHADRVDERIEQRAHIPIGITREDLGKVCKPDPLRGRKEIVGSKGIIDGKHERHGGKEQEPDRERGNEHPAHDILVALAPVHFMMTARGKGKNALLPCLCLQSFGRLHECSSMRQMYWSTTFLHSSRKCDTVQRAP